MSATPQSAAAEPRALIDLGALLHNLARVRELAPGRRVMAVIKANAYGHGAVTIAQALSRAPKPPEALAVARLSEAEALRSAGIALPIVVLEGASIDADWQAAFDANFSLVLHHKAQVAQLNRKAYQITRSDQLPALWLKLETGMNRLGLPATSAKEAIDTLIKNGLADQCGLMTHLACADESDSAHCQRQLERFAKLSQQYSEALASELPLSAANSAGICLQPASLHDWVRPGIMLYGSSPTSECSAEALGLKPVMTLQAPILNERHLQTGESVGYGASWQASQNTSVHTVAIGYGDGYPRALSNCGEVLADGQLRPLVGRVSMDKLAFAAGDRETSSPWVTLWGAGLPVDDIAAKANTIGYELLSNLSPRVPRVLKDALVETKNAG